MKNDWLTTSNLEFSISALSAINILSIHYKLLQAGKENPISQEKVDKAKERLISLTQRLDKLTDSETIQDDTPILGVDSNLGEFALQYVRKATENKGDKLKAIKLKDVAKILIDTQPEQIIPLIHYLDELRDLIEQYSSSDFDWVWGNL